MIGAAPVPADHDAAFPDDAVEVGRVLGAWGIRGQIRVMPFSTEPQALFSSRHWFVRKPDASSPGRPSSQPWPSLLRITQARSHGDALIATAQELPDRTAAEAMKGARIFVSRSSFPTASEGEYYWIDLIGLTVVNRVGELLGTVTDLLDTGAHSVLRVARPDATADMPEAERERLIPFVDAYVDEVRLAERRILVDWGSDY